MERNTEVKRLLRPGIADGPETLATNMTRAGAIAVNLVPLSSDEIAVLGDGLKRAKKMTVIRLKCEQRGGGGVQSRTELAVAKSVRARQMAALKLAESTALASERVCRKLGVAVGTQLKLTRTLMELEIGSNLVSLALARFIHLQSISFQFRSFAFFFFSHHLVPYNARVEDEDEEFSGKTFISRVFF